MSRLRGRPLVLVAALFLAAGCEPSPSSNDSPPFATPATDPQPSPDSGPQTTQILDFAIFRESPSHLLVDVEVFNSGRESNTVSVGGFAVDENSSRVHTAYRPERAATGHYRVRIWIGISSDGPDAFTTSHLRLKIYATKTGALTSREFPYAKEWRRAESGNGGARAPSPRAQQCDPIAI